VTLKVRTKITVFLSLLFLVSSALLADGIEVRAGLDFGAEEEASSIDDPDISLRSSRPGGFRSRQLRRKLSVELLRGLRARLKHFLSASRIKEPSPFVQLSQQDLYRLQEVYRL